MRTLLDVLQNLHRYKTNDLAQQLGITEEEYKLIEAGKVEMSLPQITALVKLIEVNTKSPQVNSPVTINNNYYNYNLGPKSRGVINSNKYSENEYSLKTPNHENTNSKTTQ